MIWPVVPDSQERILERRARKCEIVLFGSVAFRSPDERAHHLPDYRLVVNNAATDANVKSGRYAPDRGTPKHRLQPLPTITGGDTTTHLMLLDHKKGFVTTVPCISASRLTNPSGRSFARHRAT